jgi:chemotaxis protein methyltransferase WspC
VKRVESLLKREIGLSARSIGSSAVEAAVKTRLRACGTPEIDEYFARLERDPLERRALVEEIVVSETWFFRDEEVFKALRRQAASWLGQGRVLRVLSLPCATGEEAYSVAITLLEVGLRESRFSVRGVDVSERAISSARAAVYGKNSFRGVERLQQSGFFEVAGDVWRLTEPARRCVTFSQGNVLELASFSPRSFDVILCRNLLIYLDPEARARALENLSVWLADDGVLFAGHAEAIEQMDARFQRTPEATPFAYVKQRRERAAAVGAGNGAASPVQGRPRASTRGGRTRATQPRKAGAEPERPTTRASLEHATELANLGKLQEARLLCERVIADAGASPEAYCLLGIISNAAGNKDLAIVSFNKSLYLNQAHHEALVHLALLHEERGELPAAANFKRRAERARRGPAK